MLVLTRRMGESICVGGGITITVLSAQNGRARIGIEAPAEVTVNRREIQERIDREHHRGSTTFPVAAHLASGGSRFGLQP